jgi:DNA ligase D-like protein (predicted ligase)
MNFLRPMLAISATPFNSENYLFEVKWDGVRALAAIENGRWQLRGRTGTDYTPRYPEFAVLRRIPSGTVIDGELVALKGGRADFSALLQRHQRNPCHGLHRFGPSIHYFVFDLLFVKGRSLLRQPLHERRGRLRDLLNGVSDSSVLYSEGIVGCGRQYFREVVTQGHEGVMAKHLSSVYRPGHRSSVWKKIKPSRILPCVIVGYRMGRGSLHNLLLASLHDRVLRYVGQVSRGFSPALVAELTPRLQAQSRPRPVVPCPVSALWVAPELYCRVRFQEWTNQGRLRHTVFESLIATPS